METLKYPVGTRLRLNRMFAMYEGYVISATQVHWILKDGQPYNTVRDWGQESIAAAINGGEMVVLPGLHKVKDGQCQLTTDSGFPCELKDGHFGDCAVVKSTNPLHAPTGTSISEINMLANGWLPNKKSLIPVNPLNDNSLSEADITLLAAGPWKSRKKGQQRR